MENISCCLHPARQQRQVNTWESEVDQIQSDIAPVECSEWKTFLAVVKPSTSAVTMKNMGE